MAREIVNAEAALRGLANANSQAKLWAGRREDFIIDAYRGGASLSQIAERCDFSIEGIRRLLIRRDVELRPPHVR